MPVQLPTTERRRLTLAASDFHLRAAADDSPPAFQGYASKFNERTAIGNPLTWGFFEQVAPGAFTKTLSEGDQRFLVDHDTAMVVARSSAGTLRLAQDGVGLVTDADLDPNLSYVNDLIANLRNGNITGMSFGFEVLKDQWETVNVDTVGDDGVPVSAPADLRMLQEVRLMEVSAVTFPAYTSTEAALRSVGAALTRHADRELIERHVERKPMLAKYVEVGDREPGESTRGSGKTEPAESTPSVPREDLDRWARALALKHGLTL